MSGLWNDLSGPSAYRFFALIIAGYVGLYSIVEGIHERQMSRASFERSIFVDMASSGSRSAFTAAMTNFGSIQNMHTRTEPQLMNPWKWYEETNPNEKPLHLWAKHRFSLCTADDCGLPSYNYRVDLRHADLHDANLKCTDLHKTTFLNANLIEVDLSYSNLAESNLVAVDLRGSDLSHSCLREVEFFPFSDNEIDGVDIHKADLRGITTLSCDGLKRARNWIETCRDESLACGEDIGPCSDVCERWERQPRIPRNTGC